MKAAPARDALRRLWGSRMTAAGAGRAAMGAAKRRRPARYSPTMYAKHRAPAIIRTRAWIAVMQAGRDSRSGMETP